jgi:adenine-specific DNA-methyltransferase
MTGLQNSKQEILADIERRVADKILEQSNAELLKKLISNAETLTEAIQIVELGTTYKRTGLHFDKRLDKSSDTIKYLKRNAELSFSEPQDLSPKATILFESEETKTPLTHKLIIGDNYDALLNLLVQYRGAIDVIYIDPPYGKDSMGEFAKTNYDNALTRDNLLSMLYPRLVLAKQLLSDSGVIFCSIDDKNQAYVKCLFDEVFEERNFIANLNWVKTETPPSLSNTIRRKVEYVIMYSNGKLNDKLSMGRISGGDAPLLNDSNAISQIVIPKEKIVASKLNGTFIGKQEDWLLMNRLLLKME